MSDRRWTLSPKRGDSLRRLRCVLAGHDWQENRRATQRMCPRCWTVQELTAPTDGGRIGTERIDKW